MTASLVRQRSPVLLGLLLSPLLWGCSDTVVLQDAEGSVQLHYDCAGFQPAAHSTAEHSVVRQFAVRAVRFADENGDLESARGMVEANAAGDAGELERLLVEYLCRKGKLADPIPNQPYVASGKARAMAEAGIGESGLDLGTPAPPFRLPVLDRAYFEGAPSYESLSDYFGSHVLITFGGPWCPPCVQELEALVPIWERFRHRGLSVFEILYKDTPENGWRWKQAHIPDAFHTLVDEGYEVAAEYQVRGVPKSYLIGPTGEILWSSEGWGPHMPKELSDALDQILPGGRDVP